MNVLERMRLLERDHAPDGWPAVQMRDITAMLEYIQRLRDERRRLVRVLTSAVELVCAHSWSGVSDEDCELARVLRDCGYVETVDGALARAQSGQDRAQSGTP